MLKFFLVAHLTYENQWVKLHNKKNIFGFFGTPYCRVVNDVLNHVSESLTSDILPAVQYLQCHFCQRTVTMN